MPTNFDIILEVPICKEDAKNRKLPEQLSKLIIRVNEESVCSKEQQLRKLAELLCSWRKPNEILTAQPINLLISNTRAATLLREHGIENQLISNFSISITCKEPTEVYFVMTRIAAEAVVFFSISELASIHNIVNRVINSMALDNQYERPYVTNLRDCGVFAFYADTHRSLELLGTKRIIVSRSIELLNTD